MNQSCCQVFVYSFRFLRRAKKYTILFIQKDDNEAAMCLMSENFQINLDSSLLIMQPHIFIEYIFFSLEVYFSKLAISVFLSKL